MSETNSELNTARQQTKGEWKVGVSFNPGGHEKVNELKALAAAFIDAIDSISATFTDQEANGEVGRLKSLAMTNAEDAAMWAVKAATKSPR